MKVLNFLRRRGARRTFQQLYEHWLEDDGPRVEDSTHRLVGDREPSDEQSDDEGYDLQEPRYVPGLRETRPEEIIQLRLPVRHVYIGIAVFAALIITLAIIVTVLIMRSC